MINRAFVLFLQVIDLYLCYLQEAIAKVSRSVFLSNTDKVLPTSSIQVCRMKKQKAHIAALHR